MIQNIVNEVELPNEGNTRGRPEPKINKICGALRFYSSGSFQRLVGDLGGISQSTTLRILTEVTMDCVFWLTVTFRCPMTMSFRTL